MSTELAIAGESGRTVIPCRVLHAQDAETLKRADDTIAAYLRAHPETVIFTAFTASGDLAIEWEPRPREEIDR